MRSLSFEEPDTTAASAAAAANARHALSYALYNAPRRHSHAPAPRDGCLSPSLLLPSLVPSFLLSFLKPRRLAGHKVLERVRHLRHKNVTAASAEVSAYHLELQAFAPLGDQEVGGGEDGR